MIQQEIEIVNKLGLHARASAKFTQLASKFKSEVWVTRNGRRVNGKSIMGVMMLAAGKGSKIMLETDGADEQECFDAIVNLVNDKFGEGE
ncbi:MULTISPECIES: HPr family phosphocarrier protein [Undibacterium]|jgi:phosphocarrier protein|uniref:HPr family phosphocarrier protein n=2 Tax=Undibacterium TaxID=401469 RepID=A0ABS5H6G8_9BURK|nr:MULTISPECIES: HPr family phosphocarrier protein [Undibacterium]MBY0570137.1 HPr family phosphocarrier protein [Burkholderiaceae bacterium]MBC3812469.1 HPr family phosphocarrier protein [Undibacterium aquatile]MBC3877775.1 HPr family phosphocarrier protein [Undibacterium sp. FT79W]MBC3928714.1 HPr family phosphocarrier protein [Undibacterium sp. CY21W]MBK1890251.1 HPr family phosphocarrier protein [Undibacterium sp. 14-3-2]